MDLLSGVSGFFGSSLFREIKDAVISYFPPDMSEQQRAAFEIKLQEVLHRKEVEANRALTDATAAFNKRISDMEGTAKDLKSLPFFGNVVLFMRGLQRPTWGFFTMWLDVNWFFRECVFTDKQQTALTLINILVLGFLFGERAIKNLEPLILKIFSK